MAKDNNEVMDVKMGGVTEAVKDEKGAENLGAKKKSNKGMTFKRVVLLVGMIPFIVGVVLVSVILTIMLEKEITDGVQNELQVAANQVDEYFAYDVIANGVVDYSEYSDHEYIESLQENNIELTLFEKDKRLITSLKNDQGKYNEGTKADPDIYAVVSKGESYSAKNVMIAGTEYMVYYKPIFDGNGKFWGMAFAGEKESKIDDTISSAIITVIVIAAVLIVIFSIIILVVGNKIGKTIVGITNAINNMSEGSLNESFDFKSSVKEFNMIIDAESGFQSKLQESVGGAKQSSELLDATAETVDIASTNSAQGVSQIKQAIGELSITAQTMAETVESANMTVIDMGNAIDNISDNVANMNESSGASVAANNSAIEYMAKLVNASERTAMSVDDISVKISECSVAAEKIKAATDAITEISTQTNLLSLNASIEAARAGEAGQGFAVVASEIQKLADQSNTSAIEIQTVISDIVVKVEECVQKAADMTGIIKEQMILLSDTKVKIDDMSETGKSMTSNAQEIHGEVKTLLVLKEKVLSSITDLSAISEENAASSEEVNASVDEIAYAVDSSKDEASNMKELANELSNQMAFFKI